MSEEPARWFAEEVQAHEPVLRSYLSGLFPGVLDLDDVIQESYLRLWRARSAQRIHFAKAFLFKVARHVALDFLRRNRATPFDPLGDSAASRVLDDGPSAADSVSAREKLELLADAVAALPARCREVVMLRKIEGIPQKEVARRLGISERTVENHCRLGVAHCEAYLRALGIHTLAGDEF